MRLAIKSLLFSQAFFAPSQATSTYDYVIIGGGTAGLTIAARLTENPNVTVVVLEAGNDHSNDTNVLSPALYTAMYGDPKYDWNYQTVPQVHANGQVVAHPRGKQLGGSSAINFLFWTHASQQDLNNWGTLGNANWSWGALEPYFKKSETYIAPSNKVQADLMTSIDESLHGNNGEIITTFPDRYGPLDEAWPRTFENLGLAVNSDPRQGLALGGYTNVLNLNPNGRSRSYAATAYYIPAANRPNLKVLTGVHAEKVLFRHSKTQSADAAIATGVQYLIANMTAKVNAKKEVIVSAGAFGSPQILELSGVGNPELLHINGIDVVVSNENVGENLQDHIYVPIGYEVIPGIGTLDDLKNATFFGEAYAEYTTKGTGPLSTTGASSGLLSCPQIGCGDLEPPTNFTSLSLGLAEQYKIISEYFHTEAVTQELTVSGGMSPEYVNDTIKLFTTTLEGNFFSMLGVLEHPYSRGHVHIRSSDPKVYPEVDPKYLSHPFDLEVLTRIALHLQSVAKTAPLSDLLQGNGTVYQPGYYQLNENNVKEWTRKYLQSEYHPSGTCAMLPLEKGGVVDSKFRVYGTKNLRVIDASIFPLVPRANIQSLVYAIAERGADWIKEDAACWQDPKVTNATDDL